MRTSALKFGLLLMIAACLGPLAAGNNSGGRPVMRSIASLPRPNVASDQSIGLVFWAPVDRPGSSTRDLVRGVEVTWLASTVVANTPYGRAINAATNNRGARIAAPAHTLGLMPVSLMVVFWQVSTPTAFGDYLDVSNQDTDIAPGHQYCVKVDGTPTNLDVQYNNSGSTVTVTGSGLPANGALHVLIASLASGSQVLYLDGKSNGSATNSITLGSAGSNPQLAIGQQTSDRTTRNSGAHIIDARIYNRALTAAEASAFSKNWRDLYLADNQHPMLAVIAAAAGGSSPCLLALLGVGC